jgi:hypothetical protein
MKHSPTPFKVCGKTIYALNDCGENRFSAYVDDAHTEQEELWETAAFIVRACNNHDALVTALKACERYISLLHIGEKTIDPTLQQARAALAAVEQ